MSRPHRSRTGSPSRSASPADPTPSTSYRIERFDPSSLPSVDLMVTSRTKRSTAGNRLKQLLDQELEKDEIFTEVENDIDFEANENEDGVDIVDSDFDRDSDDDARAAEDESEGEREIEAQEKAEKSKRRAAARAVGIMKRPAPVLQRSARKPAPASSAAGQGDREAKRRRISFAPDTPNPSSSTSNTVDGGRRRSSARSSTVQSKLQVESRLEEAEQRRAAQPVKVAPKKKATLTQDALIAEALEVEEENRESLRRFLEQEEERRAKQRQRKERIEGPFVRWVSVGMRVKVVQEADGEKKSEDKKDAMQTGAANGQGTDATAAPDSQQQAGKEEADNQVGGEGDVLMAEASQDAAARPSHAGPPSRSALVQQESSREKPSTESATEALSAQPSTSDTTAATTSAPSASASTTAPTSASLTLDPVLEARKQASLLRTSTTSSTSAPTALTIKSELQARTLLSVERVPSDFSWLDEYTSLFGSHVDWSSYPYVPSRNRPLKPRQSICPITGLPAIYKDPRTGIPYANALAYKVITRVLEGGFVWSGGHYSSAAASGEEGGGKGKKKEKAGGTVGVGAVPPQMGIYLDDETEKGPGEVWESARANAPTRQPSKAVSIDKSYSLEKAAETPRKDKEKKREKEKEKEKKESRKPGFDVVLTNAIAPGDEKALLAQALSLPAGSTRSGRRVQRPN